MIRHRTTRLALALALLLGGAAPAWAHATYVLEAWLEPERPEPSQTVTLTVEMLDHRGAPVSDHALTAELSGGDEEVRRVAVREARAGVYRADLVARRRDWTVRIVDLTHEREEQLTAVEVSSGERASQAPYGAFAAADEGAAETPGAHVAWRWIAAVAAAALIAGIGATVWAVRRPDTDDGRATR